jgi:hypothetical protein
LKETDDYLAGLEDSQRGGLERVRDIAQRVAPDASQGKSYGIPALRVAGKPLLGFHVSSHHLSLRSRPFGWSCLDAHDRLSGLFRMLGNHGVEPGDPLDPVPNPARGENSTFSIDHEDVVGGARTSRSRQRSTPPPFTRRQQHQPRGGRWRPNGSVLNGSSPRRPQGARSSSRAAAPCSSRCTPSGWLSSHFPMR